MRVRHAQGEVDKQSMTESVSRYADPVEAHFAPSPLVERRSIFRGLGVR